MKVKIKKRDRYEIFYAARRIPSPLISELEKHLVADGSRNPLGLAECLIWTYVWGEPDGLLCGLGIEDFEGGEPDFFHLIETNWLIAPETTYANAAPGPKLMPFIEKEEPRKKELIKRLEEQFIRNNSPVEPKKVDVKEPDPIVKIEPEIRKSYDTRMKSYQALLANLIRQRHKYKRPDELSPGLLASFYADAFVIGDRKICPEEAAASGICLQGQFKRWKQEQKRLGNITWDIDEQEIKAGRNLLPYLDKFRKEMSGITEDKKNIDPIVAAMLKNQQSQIDALKRALIALKRKTASLI